MSLCPIHNLLMPCIECKRPDDKHDETLALAKFIVKDAKMFPLKWPEQTLMLADELVMMNLRLIDAQSAAVSAHGRLATEAARSSIAPREMELLEHQANLVGKVARLEEWQRNVEEAEARCCPEDVGFEEWIGVLKKRLEAAPSAIVPKTGTVYLIDGVPHRPCDCDTMKGECPRGAKRQLQTTQLSRCFVPATGVVIV